MVIQSKYHWGKFLWEYIHTICIIDNINKSVNLQISKNTIELLKHISNSIPCESCKNEFKNALVSLNLSETIDLSQSMELFKWSVDEHNKINRKNGIKDFPYTEALKKYSCIK